jgi:hypothetical protein
MRRSPTPPVLSRSLAGVLLSIVGALVSAFFSAVFFIYAYAVAVPSEFCTDSSKTNCTPCPERANCSRKIEPWNFSCPLRYYPAWKICARRGYFTRLETRDDLHSFYTVQQEIFGLVKNPAYRTVHDVFVRFRGSENNALNRLTTDDIRAVWTYEGGKYFIDEDDNLIAKRLDIFTPDKAFLAGKILAVIAVALVLLAYGLK